MEPLLTPSYNISWMNERRKNIQMKKRGRKKVLWSHWMWWLLGRRWRHNCQHCRGPP
jgi:hypothetical protein